MQEWKAWYSISKWGQGSWWRVMCPWVRWYQMAFLFHQPDVCDKTAFFISFATRTCTFSLKAYFCSSCQYLQLMESASHKRLSQTCYKWADGGVARTTSATILDWRTTTQTSGSSWCCIHTRKKNPCSSANLPTAAAHPKHSNRLLFLEQMVISQSKYSEQQCVFLARR